MFIVLVINPFFFAQILNFMDFYSLLCYLFLDLFYRNKKLRALLKLLDTAGPNWLFVEGARGYPGGELG